MRQFCKSLRKFEYLLSERIKASTTCTGVSTAQCHTLLALKECMPCSLNTLAEELGLEKSTVSRTIDGLVKTDLVSRVDNPENRRESQLSLTKQGGKRVGELNRNNYAFFGKVLAALPSGEKKSVVKSFELLTKTFELHMD